jgi:hypothetical protein
VAVNGCIQCEAERHDRCLTATDRGDHRQRCCCRRAYLLPEWWAPPVILTGAQAQEISWLLGELGGVVDHGMNILGEWTLEALELWNRVVDARAILATADMAEGGTATA